MADLQAELVALRRRLDDIETAFKLLKSEVQHEIKTGFEGVATQLPKMIAGSVETALTSALMTVKSDLVTLIAKAEATERYREEREERERRARASQLDLDLKIEEVQAKRIQNMSGQHAVLELPRESTHRRRVAVYGVLVTLVSGLLALIAAAIASHH